MWFPYSDSGDNSFEIPAHDSANTTTRLHEGHHDEHSGVLGNRDGNFDDVDEEIDLEGTDRHECRDLMDPPYSLPGVREEMNLLDNNVVLDRAWFSLARGAMAQAHTLCQFESLKLREEHAQCSEGLASVQAEKDSLMAINAEQALRIKELEQKLKSADEVHSSAVKGLESQLAQKDSALVYAERISGKTDAIRKLLPTVVGCLLQSHEYKQSLSVPFNYALQTGWGQGLAEERSEKELQQIMMRMNGFDPYSDKKMNAEYERLFSKTYSYVDCISHLSEKPMQDLLNLHPAPPPKDAPKAGSRGIVFTPKLVKAAEVTRSKDTTSLQDLASKRASEGSEAPPSKKT
ncbi:hypothetical protein Tco_0500033 [Tanacetum coccineum]